jgi:S-DNA-T family DNA segregation ATPase FtsK/SpoIIIE
VARIRDPDGPRGALVVLADDVDVAASRLEPEHQAALLEMLAVVVREGPHAGVALAVSARRPGGPLQVVAAASAPPVILSLPTRQEHALVGGETRLFDPGATPGAGEWRGARIQVSLPDEHAVVPPSHHDPAPPLALAAGTVHALVTPSPAAAVARLAARGLEAVEAADLPPGWTPDQRPVGIPAAAGHAAHAAHAGSTGRPGAACVVVADPDAWLARGALLAQIRRTGDVVLEGCAPRDARTLLRVRQVPPPLAPVPGRVWQVTPTGAIHRRSWPTPAAPTPAPARAAVSR